MKLCEVSGGYHCLQKLARQTSETAYEKSEGACGPKSETCHRFGDLSTLLEPYGVIEATNYSSIKIDGYLTLTFLSILQN